ncbi:kinesin-domain-containing protein [Gonapodya prolifera JEL478]|uniref:Kinesin-domain-containing protein n=1 Tax=Gonapodya prolifera (strain JEL478) TaxID=1344416 RepID=A0A139AYY4_GONPJ|nr:kinesin-domain-containing protein [Gonapodya prolifera JEL478]|eukprot:KXS21962.1 kinesin-domain-containing protein [Gonapodya prolifera JEL478]
MSAENILVAVRVRPFNDRERGRNAKCVVSMHDKTTEIVDPDKGGEPHKFAFDYSLWSHDGFEDHDGVLEAEKGSNYADQRKVYDELGKLVLDNALAGYNSTLMAYGQTGSGRGIIPIVCDEIFKRIATGDPDLVYQMTFSTIEIYNEQVRDLLSESGESLKVRQNPKTGFFVDGLKEVAVTSYPEVEALIEKGTKNKTVAATNMNATSSRAHTIVTLHFSQIDRRTNTEKVAAIHLVDLAGSERIASTGADSNKARLKEATNINGSLSTLGNVIAALVQQQQGKKNIAVPFRDSVLTKLLANSLGGNSKTIMIAAISPADINYDESLSTLRFVDRAKQIKTSAVVNESSTDKLIRELKEENERLRKMCEEKDKMTGGGGGGESAKAAEGMSDQEREAFEKLQAEIADKEAQIRHMAEQNKSWEQRLEEAKREFDKPEEKTDLESSRDTTPCLANLNEDPLLSKMLFWFVKGGEHVIGKKAPGSTADIQLSGLGVQPVHAVVANKDGALTITVSNKSAVVRVNGKLLVPGDKPTSLQQNDRVLLGTNQIFTVKYPKVEDGPDEPTWANAQAEIARELGLGQTSGDEPLELQNVYDEILEILPLVNEVNTISDTLKQGLKFELMVTTEDGGDGSFGDGNDGYKILVKISNTIKGLKWIWSATRFKLSAIKMQDFYSTYVGSKGAALLPYNPFDLGVEDFRLGTAPVDLSALPSRKKVVSSTMIKDFKGSNEGLLRIEVAIETHDGGSVSETTDIMNQDIRVRIKLLSIVGIRWTKGDIKCAYEFYKSSVRTDTVQEATNITFNHEGVFNIPKVDDEFLDSLKKPLVVTVWGDHSNSLEALKRKAQEAAIRDAAVAKVQAPVDVTPFKEEIARLSVVMANKEKEFAAELQKVKTDVVFKTKQLADQVSQSNVEHTKLMRLTSEINGLNSMIQSANTEVARLQRVLAESQGGGILNACFGSAESAAAYQHLLAEIETLRKEKQQLLQEVSNLKSDAVYVASREETLARISRLDGLVKEMHRIAYLLDPGRSTIVDNRPPTLTATAIYHDQQGRLIVRNLPVRVQQGVPGSNQPLPPPNVYGAPQPYANYAASHGPQEYTPLSYPNKTPAPPIEPPPPGPSSPRKQTNTVVPI